MLVWKGRYEHEGEVLKIAVAIGTALDYFCCAVGALEYVRSVFHQTGIDDAFGSLAQHVRKLSQRLEVMFLSYRPAQLFGCVEHISSIKL